MDKRTGRGAVEEARFGKETVKIISQSIPGLGEVRDEVAAALAPDAEYRVREIIQDGLKFMRHSRRNVLTTEDVNAALRLRNVEPLYGLSSQEPLKFVKVPGNTNLFFVPDNEIDLRELISRDLPPVPLPPTLTAHWLAVEGVQPAIPQNPSLEKGDGTAPRKRKKDGAEEPEVKPLVKHVLSKELQLYYDHVTKQILSGEKTQVDMCLKSVSEAPGLQQLLPYFVHFVVTTVNDNLKNLKVLTSAMRLVRALLSNPHFGIEHYCHQLLPVVLTCVVRKKLCRNPAQEDHWSLRDYAAEIVADISKRFSETCPTLQPRITKTLVGALLDMQKPLTTHYGAIVGLTALGANVVNFLLVPHLEAYVSRLEEELAQGDISAARRFEIAKVYHAIILAAGKHVQAEPDSGASLSATPTEFMDLSGDDSGGFPRGIPADRLAKMREIMPHFERRYSSMHEEFGDALEPFRKSKDIDGGNVPEAMTL